MALAVISNYIRLWQVPLFLGFVAAWLAGGPWLMRWGLRRWGQQGQAEVPLRRRAQINLLANGAGLAAMCIVGIFFLALGMRVGPRALALAAAVLGPAAMVGMSWLVHGILLGNPSQRLLPVAAASAGPLAALLLAVFLAAFLPVRAARAEMGRRGKCAEKLNRIAEALARHAQDYPSKKATTLQVLVDAGLLEAEHLRCPGSPDLAVGYLYQPGNILPHNQVTKRILVCDRRGNHRGRRLLLLANLVRAELAEADFQDYLSEPENARLAEADAAAN
jgi:hypothetical protein